MRTRVGGFHVDVTCGCCPGQGPWLRVGDCRSLTGTASLCGFSGYDDGTYDAGNPTAWAGQYRKWKTKTLAGNLDANINTQAPGHPDYRSCGGDPTCDGGASAAAYFQAGFSGFINLTCAGEDNDALKTSQTTTVFGGDPCHAFDPTVASTNSVRDVGGFSYTESATLTVLTLTGIGCDSGVSGFSYNGTATETLSVEHHFYDALAAALAGGGDVVEGDMCCTWLTEADLTTPESTASISLTGTAVIVPITVFGCDPPTAIYSVYVTLSQGSSTFEVEIGLQCMVPTDVYLPIAGPDQDPICFVRASLEPTV